MEAIGEGNGGGAVKGSGSGVKRFPDAEVDPAVTRDYQIYNMLVATVTQRVLAVLEERKARGRAAVIGTSSLVLVALLAIGGFLVNELLSLRVEQAVRRVIQESGDAVKLPPAIASLNFEAVSLEQRDGFSDQEAERLIAQVGSLYGAYVADAELALDQRQENRELLVFSVDTLARNFVQADRLDFVARLEEAAPAIAARSDVFTQTLTQSLGRRLIGQAGAPGTWTDGSTEIYQQYKEYAQRALTSGYPEVYLAFELVVRHMEGRPPAEIDELVADAESLNEIDLGAFIRLMTTFSKGHFTNSPNAASERVSRRFQGFLEAYRETSPLLEGIALEAGV